MLLFLLLFLLFCFVCLVYSKNKKEKKNKGNLEKDKDFLFFFFWYFSFLFCASSNFPLLLLLLLLFPTVRPCTKPQTLKPNAGREDTQTTHRGKNKTTKDLTPRCPRVSHQFLAANAFLPVFSPPPNKRRTPRVSGPSGSKSRATTLFSPRKGGKKGKNEAKIQGCLIEPQEWQPFWGPFWIKKIVFALRFRRFCANRVKNGVQLSTRHRHIYIYIYIHPVPRHQPRFANLHLGNPYHMSPTFGLASYSCGSSMGASCYCDGVVNHRSHLLWGPKLLRKLPLSKTTPMWGS